MISRTRQATLAAVAGLFLAMPAAYAQQQRALQPDPTRPANAAANLPSDTGSQTTLPSGAVTGAGQPQGIGRQPDVGSPGGLERRARRDARTGSSATSVQPDATTGATAGTAQGAVRGDGTPAGTRRPARQSRG